MCAVVLHSCTIAQGPGVRVERRVLAWVQGCRGCQGVWRGSASPVGRWLVTPSSEYSAGGLSGVFKL